MSCSLYDVFVYFTCSLSFLSFHFLRPHVFPLSAIILPLTSLSSLSSLFLKPYLSLRSTTSFSLSPLFPLSSISPLSLSLFFCFSFQIFWHLFLKLSLTSSSISDTKFDEKRRFKTKTTKKKKKKEIIFLQQIIECPCVFSRLVESKGFRLKLNLKGLLRQYFLLQKK